MRKEGLYTTGKGGHLDTSANNQGGANNLIQFVIASQQSVKS